MINPSVYEPIDVEKLENLQGSFNMALTSITVKDIINEARAVPAYRGDGTYELSHFISEVETLIGMVTDNAAKQYIFRILTTKIQGDAAVSIRRIQTQNPDWETIKKQLIKSFGVQETYLKLKEKADSTRFINVSQYYEELSKILDKLNVKYNLDVEKPIDFKPKNNEISILEKFLNKLPRSDSMYLRIKQVDSLEQAYHELIQTGIDTSVEPRNKNQTHKNSLPNQPNRFHNNSVNNNTRDPNRNHNNNYSNNNRRNSRNPNGNHTNFHPNNGRNQNQYYSNNSDRMNNSNTNTNFYPNSGRNQNQRNPNNSERFNNNHTNTNMGNSQNNRPNNTGGNDPQSRQFLTNNQTVPMEVDHVEIEGNFQSEPREAHYQ